MRRKSEAEVVSCQLGSAMVGGGSVAEHCLMMSPQIVTVESGCNEQCASDVSPVDMKRCAGQSRGEEERIRKGEESGSEHNVASVGGSGGNGGSGGSGGSGEGRRQGRGRNNPC